MGLAYDSDIRGGFLRCLNGIDVYRQIPEVSKVSLLGSCPMSGT